MIPLKRCTTCAKKYTRTKWCSGTCKSRWINRLQRGVPGSDIEYSRHLRSVLSKTCETCECHFTATRKPQRCCTNACVVRGRKRVSRQEPKTDRDWAIWKASTKRTDGLKTCPKCARDKPVDREHFAPINTSDRKWSSWCRQCTRTAASVRHSRQRLEALRYYSKGKLHCSCCKEKTLEFLAIDHIHNGGRLHRKIIKISIYAWLAKHGFPLGYRVLCHNCNMAIGFYGVCPHAKKGKS